MNEIFNKFSLNGKVAIVTGASKGLGSYMAKALAQAGADIVLTARSMPLLEELATVIEGFGRKALPIQCDVSDHTAVQKMIKTAADEMEAIDILINNAGVAIPNTFKDISHEEWEKHFSINLNSAFSATQAVGNYMLKQRRGKVINISSVLGTRAHFNSVAYCTTKAAMIQLTRTLAFEWARFNVNVNAIAPGYIRSEMSDIIDNYPDTKRRILEHIPSGRLGEPEELDGLVIFLSSAASDYITGQTVFIDGGYLSW